MVNIQRKVLGSYQTNCYLLVERDSGDAILVDAPADADSILSWLAPNDLQRILLTHGHPDHVGALEAVRSRLQVPVAINPEDVRDFNLKADESLEAGDVLVLGETRLEVVHIPGHTQGSVALKVLEQGQFSRAIVGDAIFPGGPGHTSSHQALLQSLDALEQTVFTWEDEVELLPGHGPSTTVGAEREAFTAFRQKTLPENLYGDVLWR